MTLAELIHATRKAKGLKQAELGEMVGVSGGAVGNWERGAAIAQDNLDALVATLGMDLSAASRESIDAQVGRARSRGRGKQRVQSSSIEERKSTVAYPTIGIPAITRYATQMNRVRSGASATFYQKLRDTLDENRRTNLDKALNMGGIHCSFDYISDKVVAYIELNSADEGAAPASWFRDTPKLLWRLAVARQFLSPESKPIWPRFVLFLALNPNLLLSKAYERLAFEARVMGIDIEPFREVTNISYRIERIESGDAGDSEGVDLREDP